MRHRTCLEVRSIKGSKRAESPINGHVLRSDHRVVLCPELKVYIDKLHRREEGQADGAC